MRRVRAGIDTLLESPWPVAGKRVGLITNGSGVTSGGVPTWKALRGAANVRLVRLFGPEHGLVGGAVYMGDHDTAYRLLTATDCPSWLYAVTMPMAPTMLGSSP